jgi:GNAT superfamily N-acetyltransferase
MHSHQGSNSAAIRQATPDEWRTALELVLATIPAADRGEQINHWVTQPDANESLAGLMIAKSQDLLLGAALARPTAGRSATLWPAQLAPKVPKQLADRLIDGLLEWLHAGETCAVQALLPIERGSDHELLGAHGFEYVADLLFQIAPLDRRAIANAEPLELPIEMIRYAEADRPRLRQVIEQTYEASLDCPALETAREIDDVLDGYAAGGDGGTSGWFLATIGDLDVGCLLLAHDRRHGYTEVAYMGLVPSVRGRGWGGELIRFAERQARDVGVRRLALAVDAANAPAIAIYGAAGFVSWQRRSIYLRRIDRRKDA